MRVPALLIAIPLLASCAKRSDPGWATAGAGVTGDGTVTGAPAFFTSYAMDSL